MELRSLWTGGGLRISSLDFTELTIAQLENGELGFDVAEGNDARSIGINLEGVEEILSDAVLEIASGLPPELDPAVTADEVRVYAAPWAWFWTHADGSIPDATPGIDLSRGMFVVGVGDGTIAEPGVFGDPGLAGPVDPRVPFYKGLEALDSITMFVPEWFDRDYQVIVAEVQLTVRVTIPALGPAQPLRVRLYFFLRPTVVIVPDPDGNTDPDGNNVQSGIPDIQVWGYILWLGLANGNFDPVIVQPVLGAIRGVIDGPTQQVPNPECVSNAQCAGGRTCVLGMCLRRTDACSDDADCGGGEICRETAFQETGLPCSTDANCPAEDPECRAGFCGRVRRECVRLAAWCRKPEVGFTVEYDCAAGEVCPDWLCIAGGSSQPCGDTEVEYHGMCYPMAGGCFTHLNCPPGQACLSAIDHLGVSCVTDSGCPGVSRCQAGECVVDQLTCLPSDVRCNSDADCNGRCLDGLCIAGDSAACSLDSDCGPWQLCVGGECINGSRTCQSGTLAGLYDCSWPDEYCLGGLCVDRGQVCLPSFPDDLFPFIPLDAPREGYVLNSIEGQCGYGRQCLQQRCVSPCLERHGEDASQLVIAACQIGDSVRGGLDTLHRDSAPLVQSTQLDFFTHWAIAVPNADAEPFQDAVPVLELGVCPMVLDSIDERGCPP